MVPIRIYIANRMSGLADPWAFFDEARDYLLSLGHDPVSPADLDREGGMTLEQAQACTPHSALWRERLKKDMGAISTCDAIAFGPSWMESPGARLEREWGFGAGLRFFRVDPSKPYFIPERLVGVAGYAQVGKDSAAAYLEQQGWVRRGFAAALKEIAYATNPIIPVAMLYSTGNRRLQSIVDEVGWEGAKKHPEVREYLQRLGTEGGRAVFGDQFWVAGLFKTTTAPDLVVPDVRFPSEKQSIEDRGGVVIRIERKGYGPVNGHESEVALDDAEFAHTIQNDGTPQQLGEKVLEIVRGHYGA